ncbi:NAD-dependent epimerase/dehydratase family protein [bacterium]|nr:MAG: NAD-dependent epimerase/dehydratase family protein [bacterium]
MNVLVIGATGYIGAAVCEALRSAGHTVTGTARSPEAAQRLRAAEVEPVTADITDPASLKAPAQHADAVIYAVQYNGADGAAVEDAALHALVDALARSNKPLIFTSGVWIYGSTGDRIADERSANCPTPLVAHRPALERIVLDGVARGVHTVIIRPGDVYGHGRGIPALWIQSAKQNGVVRYVGDGSSHWPVVHVEDLAQLYLLALTKAEAGSVYNAGDGTAFTVREMAEAASEGAGTSGKTEAWPLEEARKALGAFADALVLDMRITSRRAQQELGWKTRPSTILDDLRTGSYRH